MAVQVWSHSAKQLRLSSRVPLSYSSCAHIITLKLCMRKRKKRVSVSVHLCSHTEMMMLLLWALSSTLNISVYSAERGGGGPSKSRELRGKSARKTDRSRWFIVLFWKSLQGRLLEFEHLWRTDSPRGEVTTCDVTNLD